MKCEEVSRDARVGILLDVAQIYKRWSIVKNNDRICEKTTPPLSGTNIGESSMCHLKNVCEVVYGSIGNKHPRHKDI